MENKLNMPKEHSIKAPSMPSRWIGDWDISIYYIDTFSEIIKSLITIQNSRDFRLSCSLINSKMLWKVMMIKKSIISWLFWKE